MCRKVIIMHEGSRGGGRGCAESAESAKVRQGVRKDVGLCGKCRKVQEDFRKSCENWGQHRYRYLLAGMLAGMV